ncbi:MAG: hypothetical protein NT141_00750 [candidate division WWE3 bacterium]|nr:hypothetical protein [candidate division WWE3 bacterium]
MRAAILQRIKYLKDTEVTRTLPYSGEVLVNVGGKVSAYDHIAAAKVSFLSQTLIYSGRPVVRVGDWVKGGDCLAKSGFFTKKTSLTAPFAGSIISINLLKHEMLLESPKRDFFLVAGLAGDVSAINQETKSVTLKTDGILLRGVAGLGSGFGELTAVANLGDEASCGKVVFTDFLDQILLAKARTLGVAAIIAGGTDWETYLAARAIPNFGLVLIGGFGHLPILPDIMKIIKKSVGKFVAVYGDTGTVFMPTIDPVEIESTSDDLMADLAVNARVKVYAWPHFGEQATVIELLSSEFRFDSGVLASAVKVRFTSNEEMIVPVESVGILV